MSTTHPVHAALVAAALILTPAPAAATQPTSDATLRVRVVDTSELPLSGARVNVLVDGRVLASGVTGDDGAATLSGLGAGRVSVSAAFPGLTTAVRETTVAAGQTGEVTLRLAVEFTEVVVVGGYRPPASTTASKLGDVPAHETPFSAQFIPARVLEDQQARTLNDALRNVSGVATQAGIGNLVPRQRLRGFVPQSQLKNGFRQNLLSTLSDLANVEQIEVLKGPASALYGTFEPGGIVNMQTKRPLWQPLRRVEFAAGSYDAYRLAADVSGPMADRWAYRLNAAFENAGSHRDFVDRQKVFVAPAVTWRPSARTTFDVQAELLWHDGGFDRGFGNNATLIDLPVSRNLGEPTDSAEYRGIVWFSELRHRLSDAWTVRAATLGSVANLDMEYHTPAFPLLIGRNYGRAPQRQSDRQRDVAVQTELYGEVATGGVRHSLLVGVEAGVDRNRFGFERAPTTRVNVDAPVYGQVPGTFTPFSIGMFRTSGVSLYVQDQIALHPAVRILAGGRFDAIESQSESEFSRFEPPFDRRRDTPVFSPRVGLTWLPVPAAALHVSYSRAFRTDLFGTIVGGLPEPSYGEQVEGGVKGQWLGGRLSATASVFRLTKRKALTANPNDPFGPSLQVGEQRATGFEIDVLGEPARGVSLIGSYAFTDATVTRDTTIAVGSRLPNVPRHQGSVWAAVELPPLGPGILSIGGGLFASGARAAVLPNNFDLPGFTRVDALVAYRYQRIRIAVNLQNLTDERYFESGGGFVPIYPQSPRQVLASVGVVF